ncbi:histidine kinase [Brevibacillus fluminis]|uniref:histidine kinase n=1 Tax=Brevibacillus fluminis TaxID=511487 RepID=A0A3M8DI91_9BACL|nr:transporter substrate-binding domain-containing protein [Brevibacillus fluminis]RNB87181.1 histidine kinase [Brevibacillus fluminis]
MHIHKRTISAILLFFLLIAFALPGSAERQKVIRIAGDNNFPPFEYFAQSGVYSGFNVDMMNAISLETGMNIEFVPLPWDEALKALQNGEVDAVQGMKYSPARDAIYDFSDPYFTSSQGIFVRKDNMYIFQIDDLDGRRIAIQKGDIANDLLRKHHNAQFVTTSSQEEAVQLLLAGKVDAFVGNRITGQYFIQKTNQQDQIKIVGEPINPTDYGVAVMPRNHALLKDINKAILRLKQNGTYDKIERKWFGEYIMPNAPNLYAIMKVLQIVLIVVGTIVVIVLWWNRVLKREVKRRTVQIGAINQQLKEKMEQLEENVQFQQQLLDSTYSFYVTLDKGETVSRMNRKAARYLGGASSLVGLPMHETLLSSIIPREEVVAALTRGEATLQKETVWNKPVMDDGVQRTLRYNIFPIVSPAQEITGAIINFMDVTEQVELEKKMEQEERLRSLGQLILGIAHEIRNPLTSILTYTELLPTKFDNPKFRAFFSEQVPGEIKRLNGLVSDLLDYARPKQPHPVSFAAGELIEAVLGLCQQNIKERGVDVHVQMEAGLMLYTDFNQTKQVAINIILNGVEAMQPGGQLTIQGTRDGTLAKLLITDTGEGIAPDDRYRVFEPFYTTKPHGVGLGLPTTYHLVKENGGTIDIESKQGSGTSVIIRLPMPQEGSE